MCMKNVWKRGILLGAACLPLWVGDMQAARKVPISFEKYHGYTGSVTYLKAVQQAYPGLTQLKEIGKSAQGRPIYVLVITNQKTGTTLDREKKLSYERKLEVPNPPMTDLDLGKSGHLLTGATHGNEMTGTEVCLYFIDQLLSAYGEDKAITDLVDTKVFYVCPANNPDGLYNTVELGATQRSNSMYQDTARAPQRKDLNKDGLFAQVRYKDPKGMYRVDSVDARVMVRLDRDSNYPADQRYSVISEAEPDKGIDINRNFPEAWWRKDLMPGGTGEFATSAPEVHALCEFVITHPNIIMVNEYHTMGGHVYRPMGSAGDDQMQPRDVAVYDYIMGKKYLELMGEEMPEAWKNPQQGTEVGKDALAASRNKYAAARGYELPYEWKVPYDEKADKGPYYGLFLDWLYKQCGMYSIVTELWNPAHDVPELKGLEGNELQRAILAYLDKQPGQKLYLDWQSAKHPEHGDVEVGGWLGNVGRNNAYPGKVLESICERQWQFDLFRSQLMPQMAIGEVTVKKQGSSGSTTILEITAEVSNEGKLPTGLQKTEQMAFNRGDVVWLAGPTDKLTFISGSAWEKLGNLSGTMAIPGFKDPKGNKRTVRWVVAVEGHEKLKVVASSLKGGTVMKEVNY